MNGYSNLASSPPPVAVAVAAVTKGARARRSLELTHTKETNAWEGLAIGAVTLARPFSTGSQRLCSRSGDKARGALPGAMRRAFSMRRHPAAPGKGDGHYWRIHDMEGDSDHGDGHNAAAEEERGVEKEHEEKKEPRREEGRPKEEAKTKKKRGNHNILKACKKLFRL
ncbi:hypothetical protein TRIUR3_34984 [Triticum urartu]|uniref:Uncharacterized protein n=1 Tax=Triticum urartu TaxID=4572 RepID=M7YR29_TRIUA|nr:hypothetical protein TRIUR3_34984 [Triticum urartu]